MGGEVKQKVACRSGRLTVIQCTQAPQAVSNPKAPMNVSSGILFSKAVEGQRELDPESMGAPNGALFVRTPRRSAQNSSHEQLPGLSGSHLPAWGSGGLRGQGAQGRPADHHPGAHLFAWSVAGQVGKEPRENPPARAQDCPAPAALPLGRPSLQEKAHRCDVKAKKGDQVSVHYRVREMLCDKYRPLLPPAAAARAGCAENPRRLEGSPGCCCRAH